MTDQEIEKIIDEDPGLHHLTEEAKKSKSKTNFSKLLIEQNKQNKKQYRNEQGD